MRGREETLMLDFSLAKTEEKRKKKAMIAQTKLKMFRFNGRTYWVKIDIEEFSAGHDATKDLGDHATSKDFFNLSSTMIIWKKSFDVLLLAPVQKEMKHSQLVMQKFQRILD